MNDFFVKLLENLLRTGFIFWIIVTVKVMLSAKMSKGNKSVNFLIWWTALWFVFYVFGNIYLIR